MTQGTFNSSGSVVEDQQRRMSVISGHRIGETIHSGHFMVSDFEPESEAQDEEYEVGMPIPPGPEEEVTAVTLAPAEPPPPVVMMRPLLTHHPMLMQSPHNFQNLSNQQQLQLLQQQNPHNQQLNPNQNQQQLMTISSSTAVSIDGSLTKLFQCMSLAYRQKLTSPKWNRFKGVRLRWKDKIRLNNVIWRCWHMQFIMKKKTLVCQFASPLDVDTHNKPEAVVMEGKYWKRKLSTVAAEYKKWRLFYRNRIMGWTHNTPTPDLHPVSLDGFDWSRSGTFGGISNMIFDDDLLMDFTDTLFSSLSSQPFAFPNPREIARAGMVADFIQPGLVQLQPNLEDFMDTLEPLQDYVNSKLLPPVPEELDNFEPPDSLLSEDVLPSMGNKGADKGRSSSLPSMEGFGQNFYQMSSSMNGGTRGDSNSNSALSSSVNKTSNQQPLLKESPRSSSRGGYNNRNDLFAKPLGKPRGRSRSGGGRGQQILCSNLPSAPCAPSGASGGHLGSMILPGQQQQQMSNASMINSNTLLSHLLTNSGGNGSQYGGDKVGGQMMGNIGPLNMIMSEITQQSHVQQHQQQHQPQQQQQLSPQAWTPSPKNSNDGGLHQSIPINFGMGKGILLPPIVMGSSKGGGSPPLLHGAPSPPMGPPLSGPSSPSKPFRPKSDTERVQYKEHRRVSHINAEQKRRCNIKNGFDTLHSLIPQLSHNPNAKVSKAAMLQKGAEYIRQLKLERAQLKEEIEAHRQEVETLNSAINNCQSMLPATGAPVSRQRTNKMKEMFEQWVRIRTNDNWKFWIFSCLVRPLLDSYNNSVSTTSVDELCRTALAWVDQHCSLVDLRPVVLNSLRYLCTTTDILSNPANLPDEAYKAVNRGPHDQDTKGDQR